MALPSVNRPPVLFATHTHQVVSNCIHLLGLAVLSYCLAHYIPSLGNWRKWAGLSWGRLCVVLVLFDSWLFVFVTGVLVNGVGLSYSTQTCALAIYTCISFYVLSKVLIYAFLIEKVYIVWSGGRQIRRSKSTAYRICGVVMLGYVAVLILMIIGQNSLIREDGICIIGLKNFATIPMITYDLFLNVFLTTMFIWPLWRSTVISHTLRKVAIRTLYGAIVSLTTSAANIAVLTILRGKEYGWVCLGSCVTDVALNAVALSWVMAGPQSHHSHVTVNRISLTTPTGVPIKLSPNLDERGDLGSPLPESFYDYLPRDQVPQLIEPLPSLKPQPEPQPPSPTTNNNKRWYKGLKPGWRRPQRSSHSATPLTEVSIHVMQSISMSDDVSPGAQLQANSDVDIVGDGPKEGKPESSDWHQVQYS